MAHTPGPWREVETSVTDDKYRTIEAGDGLTGRGFHICGFMSPADSRLIAAAPDLLAALKSLLADIDSGVLVRDITRDGEPGWSMHMLDFVKRLQSAQAAIAKAEKL